MCLGSKQQILMTVNHRLASWPRLASHPPFSYPACGSLLDLASGILKAASDIRMALLQWQRVLASNSTGCAVVCVATTYDAGLAATCECWIVWLLLIIFTIVMLRQIVSACITA